MRHLAARGDCRVVLFGQSNLADDERLCDAVVNADLSHVRSVASDPLCVTEEMQREGFKIDHRRVLEACGGDEPVALICVNGYSPTFSHVWNPTGATIQCAAINYAAPILGLLESLKIPRICVNNDPRTYPRDQEMSHGWEWSRPRALLDQCDSDRSQVVGGRRYRRVSKHGRVESWSWLPKGDKAWHDKAKGFVQCVAHAHFTDGIRNGSMDAWEIVFSDCPVTNIHGAGWESYIKTKGHPHNVGFEGKCKPSDVTRYMDESPCAPVVSHTPGFYTGKPYLMVSRGCMPLLFGDGTHSHTYDPKGLLQPLDSGFRITREGDFRELFESLASDEEAYDMHVAYWQETCQPDYSLLDELVDKLLDGTFREDPDKWGGYVPA